MTVENNRVTKISADKQNPHSWRDFCAKGRTANQLVEHPRRILNPMRRVGAIELAAAVNEQPRRGVVVIDRGWGSGIFYPRGGSQPESYGANRNLLIDGGPIDPLSQTAALSSSYVGVERV